MLPLKTQEKIKFLKKILFWPRDFWRQKIPPRRRALARWVSFFIITATFLSGSFLLTYDQSLFVYFFDVGQGDGALIKLGDFEVLIDGGPQSQIVRKMDQVLPFYDRTIELVILTHPHSDHLNGQIEVLKRYKVKKVLYSGVLTSSPNFLAWLQEIQKNNIHFIPVSLGEKYFLKPSFCLPWQKCLEGELEILYPFQNLLNQKIAGKEEEQGGLNDTSLVARLDFQNVSFLFTGDITFEAEKKLLEKEEVKKLLAAEVLKVAHHGSRFSSSEDFLKAVQPKYAVIQVGKNRYGHPAFSVIWRLQKLGALILRNDLDGDILFKSDGKFLQFQTSKKNSLKNNKIE